MALFGSQAAFGGFGDGAAGGEGDLQQPALGVPSLPEASPAPPSKASDKEVNGGEAKDIKVQTFAEFAKEHNFNPKVAAGVAGALDFDSETTLVVDFAFLDEQDFQTAIGSMEVDGAPANRIQKGQAARLFATARSLTAASGLAVPGVEAPAVPPPAVTPSTTLMAASAKAPPATPSVPKTVYKFSTYIDQADDGVFHLLGFDEITKLRARYFDLFGDDPASPERPSDEQLSGLKAKLETGRAPYIDFGVFGQFSRRTTFFRKFEDQVLIDGRFRNMVIKGPANFVQWKSSWRIFRNAMIMLGAGVPAHFDRYEEGIRQLIVAHGNQSWATIAVADDLMRSEEWQLVFNDRLRANPDLNDPKVWSQICSDTAFRTGEGVRTHWWWERVTAPLSRGDPNRVVAEMEGNETGIVANISVGGQEHTGHGRRAASNNPRPKAKAKTMSRTMGACWAWNEGSCSKPCPNGRPHVCLTCGGSHRVGDCNASGTRNGKGGNDWNTGNAQNSKGKSKAKGKGKGHKGGKSNNK